MSSTLAMVLEVTLKSSVVLGLAGGVAWLLRGRTAAVRHAVWSGALAAILMVPVVSLAGPRLRVVPVNGVVFDRAPARVDPGSDEGARPVSAQGAVFAEAVAAPASPGASASVSLGDVRRRERASVPAWSITTVGAWDGWSALWLGGMLAVLAWMLAGELSLIRLARRSASVRSGAWATTLGRLRCEGLVPHRVRVLESESSIVPMTHGVLRPLVLVPAAGRSWSAAHRRDVLLHELAHVRRRDGLTHGIARLACVLHWFNPLAWIALQRTRVEREHACDDAVLAAGSPASSYASSLLATARSLRSSRLPASAGLAMAAGSTLGDRLRAILDAGRRRSRPRPVVTGAVLVSSLMLALPLAALAPSAVAGTAGDRPPRPSSAPVRPAAMRSAAMGSAAPQARVICPAAPEARSRTVKLTGSMSITGRGTASNGEDHWVVWTGADCSVVIHATGEPRFDAAETDVSVLPDGTRFEIRHADGRTERVYEVRAGDSGLERRYTVDGRDRAMDSAFETWRATLVLEFIRRSGWDAEARTLRILDRSGVRGVLDEVEYLESDRVAGLYLRTLLGMGKVRAGDVAAVLGTAGTRIESDREKGGVLAAVPPLLLATEAGRLAFVDVAGGIASDREKAKALVAVLATGSPGPETIRDLLGVARTIESDRELGRFLTGLVDRGLVTEELRPAFDAAVTTIESERERSRVLAALGRRTI